MSTLRSKSAWFPWQRLASRHRARQPSLSSALKNRCWLDSYSISPSTELPARQLRNQTFKNVLCKVHDELILIHFFCRCCFSPSPRQVRVQSLYAYVLIDELNAWSVETRAPWERDGGAGGGCVCVFCGRGGVRGFRILSEKKRIMCPINATVDHTQTPPLQRGVGWGWGWGK